MEAQLYADFDRFEDEHWWFLGRRAILRAALARRLAPLPERELLDVGCGTGGMLPLLARFGRVEALESSPDALARARRRVPEATLHLGALPDGLPAERAFDVVTLFDVIEHLADPVGALAAVRTALRPGGQVVVTVPAFRCLWSHHDDLNHHLRRYTAGLLRRELGAAGFRVEWTSYFNTLLFPPIALARLAQHVLPRRRGSDFVATPEPLNGALRAILSAERHLVPRIPLPFGVSLLAFARRAGESGSVRARDPAGR